MPEQGYMDDSDDIPAETAARYRAFISYRRRDAGGVARWLRRRLLEFSAPPNVLAKLETDLRSRVEGRRRIFLDTSYESANEDWWRDNILPALKRSDYLIVLSSPSLIEPRPDGNPHVVDKEVEAWRQIHSGKEESYRIIPAVTGAVGAEALPASLAALHASWHIVDFRAFSAWRWLQPRAGEKLDNGVLAIMSRILELPSDVLPVLRDEDAKVRGRRRLIWASMAVAVMLGLGGVSIWALTERARHQRAETVAKLMQDKEEHERDRALLQESRAVSGRAAELIHAGDAQSGMLAALSVLPMPGSPRPHSPEAALTLYKGWLWNREVATLSRHTGKVLDVAYAPDGKSIVTASEDRTALVWNMSGDKSEPKVLEHGGAVFKASFSRDSRRILTLSRDGVARVWAAGNDFRKPLVLEVKETIRPIWEADREQQSPIKGAAFSRNGDMVATLADNGALHVWDVANDVPISRRVPTDKRQPESFAISADGRRFAIGTAEGVVELWNLAASPPTKEELPGHDAAVERLSFANDGLHLVSTSSDGQVVLWEISATPHVPKPLRRPDGEDTVKHTEFSEDGHRVLVVSNSLARLVDINNPKASRSFDLPEVEGAKLGPSGLQFTIVHRNGEVGLIEMVDGRLEGGPLGFHDRPVTATAFSPDGQLVVTASHDDSARIWEAQRPVPRAQFPDVARTEGPLADPVFSPDGRRILAVSDSGVGLIWNVGDRPSTPIRLADDRYRIRNAAVNFDGTQVVTVSDDARVWVWSLNREAGRPTELKAGKEDWFSNVSFGSDGPRVVVTSSAEGLFVWDLGQHPPKSAKVPISRFQHRVQVNDPGGGSIVAASANGAVEFWDFSREWPTTGTWSNAVRLEGHRGEVAAAALSRDRLRLATATKDGGVWIWDLSAGTPTAVELAGHRGAVHTAAFSEDGLSLVTASDDGTARVWSVKSNPPSSVTVDVSVRPDGAKLTPDGSHLVTTSLAGEVLIWAIRAEPPQSALLGDAIGTASLNRDGRLVAASLNRVAKFGRGGDLAIWPMFGNLQELVDEARKTLTRCLTHTERFKLGLPPTPRRGSASQAPHCD